MKMSEENFSILLSFMKAWKKNFPNSLRGLITNINRTCQFHFPELVQLHPKLLKFAFWCILKVERQE